jgi:hypothetical protein
VRLLLEKRISEGILERRVSETSTRETNLWGAFGYTDQLEDY